jgi:hypothetical protein
MDIHIMNLSLFLTPDTKNNSKWTVDLNERAKTINILTEDIGANLGDLGLSEYFLDIAPKT